MKRADVCIGIVVTVFVSLLSGCVAIVEKPSDTAPVESNRHGPPPWAPAHGWRRQHESYYYYPVSQVYYYPSVRRYYWLEGREWRFNDRLPSRYVIEEGKKVVLDLDYEPHTQHAKIRAIYPPDYYERYTTDGKYR